MAYHYENLKLEKGMYSQSGRSFAQTLEALDPSENYKGTSLEGLDAFQRQLKRFDIKVKGAGSDRVEKFFSCSVFKKPLELKMRSDERMALKPKTQTLNSLGVS